MTRSDPAPTIAAVLRYLVRYRESHDGTGPPAGKEWSDGGVVVARCDGTVDDVTAFTVATTGHGWRLGAFAVGQGLKVRVGVGTIEEVQT